MAESNAVTLDCAQAEALTKLAEIPPDGSEERHFWLEAAEQHGFITPGSDGCLWMASPDAILRLMSEARKQGQRDALAQREADRTTPEPRP